VMTTRFDQAQKRVLEDMLSSVSILSYKIRGVNK
jgi:hypothetical protein